MQLNYLILSLTDVLNSGRSDNGHIYNIVQVTYIGTYFISNIFRFKNDSDPEYFTIKNGEKCAATIGRFLGRPKYLILDPNQCTDRDIFHELLHVLGLLHEHQR